MLFDQGSIIMVSEYQHLKGEVRLFLYEIAWLFLLLQHYKNILWIF